MQNFIQHCRHFGKWMQIECIMGIEFLFCLCLYGNEAINSSHLYGFDWSKQTKPHYCCYCHWKRRKKKSWNVISQLMDIALWQSNTFAEAPFPHQIQSYFRFSNFVICIAIEQIECDYIKIDRHWPSKMCVRVWMWFLFWTFSTHFTFRFRFRFRFRQCVSRMMHN